MRQYLGALVGLIVGGIGAFMFSQSLPPEEGSTEEQLEKTSHELERAQLEIAALRAEGKTGRPGRTTADGMRSIAEDIKAGRLVDVDDVFKTAKPWMRNLAPVFDRMRVRDQKKYFDTIAGEWAREYGLNRSQQNALEQWLDKRAEENSAAFSAVINDDSSGLEDMIRATRNFENRLDGFDDFMGGMLEGDTLAQFEKDRMLERVERVQNEADRKMHRLDRIVGLDEPQKDEVFSLMARSSGAFDPSMQFEGLESEGAPLTAGQARDEALIGVMRPDQALAYEAHRQEQIAEAEEELREVGLKLPANWDLLDEDDF